MSKEDKIRKSLEEITNSEVNIRFNREETEKTFLGKKTVKPANYFIDISEVSDDIATSANVERCLRKELGYGTVEKIYDSDMKFLTIKYTPLSDFSSENVVRSTVVREKVVVERTRRSYATSGTTQ